MCLIFGKLGLDGLMIGRSFDWVQYGGNICFVPSYRSYGVSTIGCCFIEQMGEDRVYEGMNTQGLFVAVVALPTLKDIEREETPLKMNSLSMVRYVLERSHNVEEAMHIVKSFTIDYRIKYGWPKVQYFFADADNNLGLYEEGVSEEIVKLSGDEYRIMTNKSMHKAEECKRYNIIRERLDSGEEISLSTCMDSISKVTQATLTAWSSVYDIHNKSFSVCIEQNFDKKYTFKLKDCLKRGHFSVDFAELKLNTRVTKRKKNEAYTLLEVIS